MKTYLSAAALLTALGAVAFLGRPAAADETAGWGTIKGRVVWAGDKVPKPEKIDKVETHPDKAHCLKNGPLYTDDLVVNPKDKGVRWVFVWLAPNTPGSKIPIHPDLAKPKDKEVSIDQPCCQFEPHALCMRQGQDLVAKNSAPVAHNVKWQGNPLKNPGGNVIVPPGGSYTIKNLKADRFPLMVNCNIHPWMSARVGVFDHPYATVTDKDGEFEIKQAPAGNFRLMVWQEKIGWLGGVEGRTGRPIVIAPNATTDVGKLELKPSE